MQTQADTVTDGRASARMADRSGTLMDAVPLRPEENAQPPAPAQRDESEPALQHQIRLVRDDGGADLNTLWNRLNDEGTRHFLAGTFYQAQTAFEAALETARQFPPTDLRIATSVNNLGETYRMAGRLDEAMPLLQEALSQRLAILGAQHPHVARSRNNLGFLCETLGRYQEALQHYRDAYAAMSRLPAVYPVELSATLLHLARLAATCGAHEQAQGLLAGARDIIATCLKPQDAEAGLQLYITAQVHEMGGQRREAWRAYRSAIRLLAGALGNGHYLLAPVLAGAGRTLRARGHTAVAERFLHRALEILEATFEPSHHEIGGVLNSLGELYRSSGRSSLSELLYRRALHMVQSAFGESHPDVAAVLCNLALLHEQQGDQQAADELMAIVGQIDDAVQFPPPGAFDSLNTARIGR